MAESKLPAELFDSNSILFDEVKTSEAFVAIDYDYRFLYVNHLAEKFYSKKKEELIGRKIEDAFPSQWNFGPFMNVMQSVKLRLPAELNYKSPFANAWVQLFGRPFENYYTFTYWMIDQKEMLKRELRKHVGRQPNS
jgi:hypothetical protein